MLMQANEFSIFVKKIMLIFEDLLQGDSMNCDAVYDCALLCMILLY